MLAAPSGPPCGSAEGSSAPSWIPTDLPPARAPSAGGDLVPQLSFLLGSRSPGLHSTAHSGHPRAAIIIIIIIKTKNICAVDIFKFAQKVERTCRAPRAVRHTSSFCRSHFVQHPLVLSDESECLYLTPGVLFYSK